MNEKSRIFKIHDLVINLYESEKYADVIQNMESYVDTFKLVSYGIFHYSSLVINRFSMYSRLKTITLTWKH